MRKTDEKRFLEKVKKTDTCWLWQAGVFNHGYGEFRFRGTMQNAHRVSWILFKSEIPEGIKVLHSCDTPLCVNPDHLFLGTDLDNSKDKYAKHREHILKGSENGNSKITEQQAIEIKKLYRQGNLSQKRIGELFGINQQNVSGIINGTRWKHIK